MHTPAETPETPQMEAQVRDHLTMLSQIPFDDYEGCPDQIRVFEWFVQLQKIIGEQFLPPALRDEVIRVVETGKYVYHTRNPDPGTLISAQIGNGNFYLYHSLKNQGGIHPSQLGQYARLLADSSRSHVLDTPVNARLRELLGIRKG